MKYKWHLLSLLVILSLTLGAAGCAQEPTETAEPEEEKVWKVALLIRGVVDDAGWGAAAYDGLMKAEDKYGVEVAYSEETEPPEMAPTFRDYASQGYDVLIGHGDDFSQAALEVSAEFPDLIFAVTNAGVKGPNLQGLDTKNTESGYIAGIIAGTLTETKHVGYISVMEIVSMVRGEEGFRLGVEEVCPDCEVHVIYTGDFVDIAKGKEAALTLIDAGVDISFQYADAPGLGAIEAAQETGDLLIIGSGQDQSSLAPDYVVTTVIQDLAPLIVDLVGQVLAGEFQGNTVAMHGFDTGIYYLADLNPELMTPEQMAVIESYYEKLQNGEVDLPHLEQTGQ